jgi:ElaB/YqjD/DUF883 family membrane-anchored ribosome-binding protein
MVVIGDACMTYERGGIGNGTKVEATKAEAEDMLNQAAGAVQDIAVAGRDLLQDFVEDRPYTTAAIALGLGLLIGYSAHRPAPPRRGWWD